MQSRQLLQHHAASADEKAYEWQDEGEVILTPTLALILTPTPTLALTLTLLLTLTLTP